LDNTKKNILDYSIGDGLRVGLAASWNLFDGGRTKKLNEISELRIKSQAIQIEQIELPMNRLEPCRPDAF